MYGLAGSLENELHVLNITDPFHPEHMMNLKMGDDDLKSFSVNYENTLALAGFSNYVSVIKISMEDQRLELAATLDLSIEVDFFVETWSFRFANGSPIGYFIQG